MNPNEPLGLPRGSVRAILALVLVVSVIAFNAIAMLTGTQPDQATIGLAGMVVGYYFGKRDTEPEAPAVVELHEAVEPLPPVFIDGDAKRDDD